MAKKYLSLEEAAFEAGVSVEELKNLRAKGDIRGFADRGTWKFRSEDVEELIRRRVPDSDPELPISPPPTPPKKIPDSSGKLKPVRPASALEEDEDLAMQPTMITRGRGNTGVESSVRLSADDEMEPEFTAPKPGSDSDVQLISSSGVLQTGRGSESQRMPKLPADNDDSDVRLAGQKQKPSDLSSGPLRRPGTPAKKSLADELSESDSDVKLLGGRPGSDSDVKLAGGKSSARAAKPPGSDSDVKLLGGATPSDSDVKLAGGLSGVRSVRPTDQTDEILLSDLDSGISLGQEDSGISLDTGDSGITLGDVDSGISLGAGPESGISLDAGESGLSLDTGESGLSLDSGDSGITLDKSSSTVRGRKSDKGSSSVRSGSDSSSVRKKPGSDSEISITDVQLKNPSQTSELLQRPKPGSGIRGSGISSILDDDEDSGLVLPGDSGVRLAGKSGIRMSSPSDSGILLSRPGDSGINLSGFGAGGFALAGDSGVKATGSGTKPGSSTAGQSKLSDLANRLSGVAKKDADRRNVVPLDDLDTTAPMMLLAEDDDVKPPPKKPDFAATASLPPMDDDEDELNLMPPEASDDEDFDQTTNVILFDDDEDLDNDQATVIRKGQKKVEEAFDLTDDEGPIDYDEIEGEDEVEVADDEMEDQEVGDLDVFQEDEGDVEEEFVAGTSQVGMQPIYVPPPQSEWGPGVFALLCSSCAIMVFGVLIGADLVRVFWGTDRVPVYNGSLIEIFGGLFK